MELNVSLREDASNVKEVRKSGSIPAVFYGRGMENRPLAVGKKEFDKVYREAGENTVVTLLIDGKKQPSIIYDVQHDPVSGAVLHVDFYGVRMDEKIQAAVPIEFVGESPAVKEKSGVLTKSLSEIEVEALPGDLPHAITVDISTLVDLDQSIYVKDLNVPKNVKIIPEGDTAIVTVVPPVKEEEIAPPAMDVADVKVESEEKAAERAADKEAEPNAQS
jgi:large subunit ribosomal protein L25